MSFEFFAVIILAIVLAVVLKSYDSLMRQLNKYKHDKEEIEEKARHHAVKIVDEAKDKALEILEGAQIKAEKGKEQVEQKLEEVSQEQIGQYKHVLQTISKNIEDGALREMEEFKKVLEMETVEAQKIIGQKIEDQYSKINKDIDEYKLRKLNEANQKILEILKSATKSILGKTLNIDDHTDLILKALEEAKHEELI